MREHGTHVKYVIDKCRCDACKTANREYERARAQRIEPAYVDAKPARDHIAELSTAGVGLKQIVKRSGVSQGCLWKLVYGKAGRGPSKRIRRSTSDAILAVTPADAADGAPVDATATWALIDTMVAAGVPKSVIARHLGAKNDGLQLKRTTVHARNARAIAAMHAEWHAGRLQLSRGDSHGNRRTIKAPTAEPATQADANDIDNFYTAVAEALEARIDRPWRNDAACRNRPPHLWHPTKGDKLTIAAAKRICDSCIVRTECATAGENEPHGTWGGKTEWQRVAIRRTEAGADGRSGPVPGTTYKRLVHGTSRGYIMHRRRGEAACDACKQAHARYQAERAESRRALAVPA